MAETTKSRSVPVAGVSGTLPEVAIGRVVGIDDCGMPLVDFPGNPAHEPLSAMCTARFDKSAVGRSAAILFANGDPSKPLVVGLIYSPLDEIVEVDPEARSSEESQEIEVQKDGDRILLSAQKEIVLKCGRASITLTRAGKILLRGAYLLSRSSGVNRIKGGSVQVN